MGCQMVALSACGVFGVLVMVGLGSFSQLAAIGRIQQRTFSTTQSCSQILARQERRISLYTKTMMIISMPCFTTYMGLARRSLRGEMLQEVMHFPVMVGLGHTQASLGEILLPVT